MINKKVPNHVAIIMDGNGRWAENKGLKRTKGHEKGAEVLKEVAQYAYEIGIKVFSVYAFSTENWKRSEEEVNYLMDLFLKYFKSNFNFIKKKDVRVIFSGIKDKLSNKVIEAMNKLEEDTKDNTNGIFNICLNYGGRSEIVEASKKISQDVKDNKLDIDDITEDVFSKYLFNDLPPIDLLIRTSGEYRISNFMLWQMAYSEIYFTSVLWPDFNSNELDKAIDSYNQRDRRFGGVKKN